MDIEQKNVIEFLHKNGIAMQDILSVMYDLRSCIRYSLPQGRLQILKNNLPKLGLEIVEYIYPPINKKLSFIGKDFGYIKEAALADQEVDLVKVGEYLGYPSCCIHFWLENKNEFGNIIPILVKNNSSQLDYRLNFILNFDSKIAYENLNKINQYQDYDKFIIPHITCSFDCTPSLKYAANLADIIKKEFPERFKTLKNCLKKVFIFVDNFTFIALEGEVKEHEIVYSKVHDFNNLFNKQLIEMIAKGNKIIKESGKILVLKNDVLVGEAELSCEVLDFKEIE